MIEPILLYGALALGAVGVLIALPRKGVNPQLIGVVIAAAGFGAAIAALAWRAVDMGETVSPFFYVFGGIALVASLRMITHQKPVYSALYFILTILSSSALYLLVGAEFMAFALIIIYAGAILITYLFVIMLATQAPREGEDLGLVSPYDAYAREPAAAVASGFVLLGVLTGMMASGVPNLTRTGGGSGLAWQDSALLAELPGKAVRALDGRGAFGVFAEPTRDELADGELPVEIDPATATVTLVVKDGGADRLRERIEGGDSRLKALFPEGFDGAGVADGDAVAVALPESAMPTNLDGVGWTLVAVHPVTLEVAGVILLMALLGAVVLARKQIEIGEDEKEAMARVMAEGGTLPGPVSGEDMRVEGVVDRERGGGAA